MSKVSRILAGLFSLLALAGVFVLCWYLNDTHNLSDSEVVMGTIIPDNGDQKINWGKYNKTNIALSDTLNITNSGVYYLTGSLSNGNIKINAIDGKVKLILDNITINNPDGPAIYCSAADDLVIELIGKNKLSDGTEYISYYDNDVSGTIYSKGDLTFQGDGILQITANHLDGIVGKDDLKFNSGTYIINAADDGIRGTDSVYIVDGNYTINSKADAIKSTNETTNGKGFVLIEKGNFIINAEAKGIKAINSIAIYNGNFDITTSDDAIHSNSYVGIFDGDINIASGDDGIHADKKLVVDGGTIDIKKSYEGLEAQAIAINGGDISVYAFDDGMNAGGGTDASASNRPGAGVFDANTDCVLSINGGDIYINSSGDGLDSNGYIYINGGNVVVDGPANNGNGALDAGAGILQNNGTVIAVGASGMASGIGEDSSVYNVSVYFDSTLAAETKIEIKDSNDKLIINHTSAKSFNHMAVGSPLFKLGETYTIYIDGKKYEKFTISSITSTIGSSNRNFNNGTMPPTIPGGAGPQMRK